MNEEEDFKYFLNNLRSSPYNSLSSRSSTNHSWITKIEKYQNTIETVLVTILTGEVIYIAWNLLK